jgi:phosphoenolpyruvate phosphomutase
VADHGATRPEPLRLDAGRGPVLLAGADGPLAARLAERAGFGGIWASGLAIATARGVPDEGVLSPAERLAAAAALVEAVALPVVADCDSGFGGPEAVARTARDHEAAGVAAICIEDARIPKRNSLAPGEHPLVTADLFARKIRAAVGARRRREFLIFARVEALVAGRGLEEALRRAHAYEAAGSDAIVVHSKAHDPGEILAFVRAWDGGVPLALIPTTYPALSVAVAARTGKVAAIIYANQAIRASVGAMRRVFARLLRDGGTHNVEGSIATVADLFDLQRMPGRKRKR